MLEVRFNQPLTLDPRGRLTLPSVLKNKLDAERIHTLVFIVQGEKLRAYTPKDFTERVEQPLMGNDAFDPWEEEKQLLRLGFASELEVDRQGRIVIPQNLREMAGLERDIVAVSMLDRLEIWDSRRFARAYAAAAARKDSLGGGPGA